MLRVIKRDGRIKDFDIIRIVDAIRSAYYDVYGVEELDDFAAEFDSILLELDEYFGKLLKKDETAIIDIEEIQDKIIMTIRKYNSVVADSYSDFRENRNDERLKNLELIKEVTSLIDQTNSSLMSENSNKSATLASTQRDLMAGEVSKAIARVKIIPKYILKEHHAGAIKIHDMDYFATPITNCELVNLQDMLWNGTVINKKKIRRPKSLRTAMTLATQIAAQVASSTYGGQTISLSHIAPFVRISKEKIKAKYNNPLFLFKNSVDRERAILEELQTEIRDSVQTFNYQVSTLMTTNGQAPFISVAMYIDENPEYRVETAMLIEEFLKQRINGMENEYGVMATQTFPKLIYFLDECNINPESEFFWLTKLAVRSTGCRMNPDYISVKKMKEIYGTAFPPMGCRAFLSPFEIDGKDVYYGRGNLGVCTINLPYVALLARENCERQPSINLEDEFFRLLDKYLELSRQVGELRFNKLKGIKASVAPILWQHGALARLDADDDILKAIVDKGFTVTIGYSGIYETVYTLIGESHVTESGNKMAAKIMSHMKGSCETFKNNQPHLRFALYGTPQESTTGWFNDRLRKRFGDIENVTDKGWITNSYHVDIREDIDAFKKLELESKLQEFSTGGAVSYIETYNMKKNPEALLKVVKHMYDTIIYAEINFESDICGMCGYNGVMDNDPDTLKWVCPQCKNDDQDTLSVVRRTCGYLGETVWTDGRKLDILNRVKHL